MKNYNRDLVSKCGQDWHHLNCYGCGPINKMGLHADFSFDEKNGDVFFSYKANINHEGAPGFIHGGILASLLDESQGVLCFHLGYFVMTDQLSMKYHRASPLHENLMIRSYLTAVRRRRLYTKGTIYSENGDLLVSSRARWYVLPEKTLFRMFKESKLDINHLVKVMEENRKRGKIIRRMKKKLNLYIDEVKSL